MAGSNGQQKHNGRRRRLESKPFSPQRVRVSAGNLVKMASAVFVNSTGIRHLIQYVGGIQYIPRNMHTVFAMLCVVVVIH